MELADLGRLCCRSRWAVLLRVLRAVSNDAGFSMGESFAFWNWRCVFDSWVVPRVRPVTGFPRKDFRLDLHSDCCARCRVFQLRNLLRPAAGAGLRWRSARWAKGTRLYTTGSKWKTGWSGRFTFRLESCRVDFLSWVLVTAMQLRVAEFPATAFGIRRARRSCRWHQRRSAGDQPAAIAKARVHVSAAVRSECEGYSPIRCAASRRRSEKRGYRASSRISH